MNRLARMITENNTLAAGNSLLLILVFITIFVVPVFPLEHHKLLFNFLYTAIFFVAVFSLQKHRKLLLRLAITAAIVEWLSATLNMPLMHTASRLLNIVFLRL